MHGREPEKRRHPGKRHGHTAVLINDKMWIFGYSFGLLLFSFVV